MKVSDIKCRKCGDDAMEASKYGRYLQRVSPKGELPIIMECRPDCDRNHGDQEDALERAITDKLQ